MKLATLLNPACAILFLAQLAVPAGMIMDREATLRGGRTYKFETAAVDPVDAFRGRYVAVQVAQRTAATVGPGQKITSGQAIFVTLETDQQGYARLGTMTRARPAGGDYLRARAGHGDRTVELPLDRFYLNEKLAPRAEQAYRNLSRRGSPNTYLLVRVRRGHAVITDLFLDGRPVREYLAAAE